MIPSDIDLLKRALAEASASRAPRSYLAYHPDPETCVEVESIERHAISEQLIAQLADGFYVDLEGAAVADFALVTRFAPTPRS